MNLVVQDYRYFHCLIQFTDTRKTDVSCFDYKHLPLSVPFGVLVSTYPMGYWLQTHTLRGTGLQTPTPIGDQFRPTWTSSGLPETCTGLPLTSSDLPLTSSDLPGTSSDGSRTSIGTSSRCSQPTLTIIMDKMVKHMHMLCAQRWKKFGRSNVQNC